jgi:hypothetical protein
MMSKQKILATIVIFLFALIMVHFEDGKKIYKSKTTTRAELLKPSDKSPFVASAKPMEAVIANNEEVEDDSMGEPESLAQEATQEMKPAKIQGPKAYLNAISSASRLMVKFLRGEDYRSDLTSIDKSYLPSEVKLLLEDMQEFADSYATQADKGSIRIFPEQGILDKIVGHFMHVDRLPYRSADKNIKYEQIVNRLYVLENYFYSQSFLNETMGSHD